MKIDNTSLQVTKHPKYLGVTYDRCLSFTKHIENIIDKYRNKLRLLAACTSHSWGWRAHLLMIIYKGGIRSVMDYCAGGWQPWVSVTNMDRLEKLQNEALRIVTGQLRTTPTEALRCEANLSSYADHAKDLWSIAYEKGLRLPIDNPRASSLQQSTRHRLVRSSLRNEGRKLTEALSDSTRAHPGHWDPFLEMGAIEGQHIHQASPPSPFQQRHPVTCPSS